MTDTHTPESISIGLDDGYAYTKLALPDGRLVAIDAALVADRFFRESLADDLLGDGEGDGRFRWCSLISHFIEESIDWIWIPRRIRNL